MFKYAIVDDDELCRALASIHINAAFEKKNCQASGKLFASAEEFLEAYKTEEFDILFTDIIMPEMHGLELTQALREKGDSIQIVFMSSDLNYSVQSYKFNVTGFIRKEKLSEDIYDVIDNILDKIENEYISIDVCENYTTVHKTEKINNIVYIETGDHCTMIYTTDSEKALRTRKSLSFYKQQIQPLYFLQINEGQLVNPKYITEIRESEVYINFNEQEIILSISRRRIKEITTAFKNYYSK